MVLLSTHNICPLRNNKVIFCYAHWTKGLYIQLIMAWNTCLWKYVLWCLWKVQGKLRSEEKEQGNIIVCGPHRTKPFCLVVILQQNCMSLWSICLKMNKHYPPVLLQWDQHVFGPFSLVLQLVLTWLICLKMNKNYPPVLLQWDQHVFGPFSLVIQLVLTWLICLKMNKNYPPVLLQWDQHVFGPFSLVLQLVLTWSGSGKISG